MPVVPIAHDFRVLAPDDLEIGQVAAAIGLVQYRPGDRRAARAPRAAFCIAEIDITVALEFRVQGDVAEPALAAVVDIRCAADRPRLLAVLGDDEDIALLLGDEHAAVRQEGHGPGLVE